jgi:hypothetical protein
MTKIERHQEAITPVLPFETLEEEAEFWDSHSALDEIDQGTLVGFHHARKSGTLTIRFTPEDIQEIRMLPRQPG